jgi:hypothetical protein
MRNADHRELQAAVYWGQDQQGWSQVGLRRLGFSQVYQRVCQLPHCVQPDLTWLRTIPAIEAGVR